MVEMVGNDGSSEAKSGTHFFVVVKMMFHAFYLLIGFVSLAGHENDVAFTGHHCCRPNGFATVGYADGLGHLVGIKAGEHIVNDVLRLFKAGRLLVP